MAHCFSYNRIEQLTSNESQGMFVTLTSDLMQIVTCDVCLFDYKYSCKITNLIAVLRRNTYVNLPTLLSM